MRSAAARLVAPVAALALTVAPSACRTSSGESADTPVTSTAAGTQAHSAGDVAFLQKMIVHHEQALELAAMVPARTADAQLVVLAQQIADQQKSEIQAFQAQLMQWEVGPGGPRGIDGIDGIDGRVDQATIDKLTALDGPAFGRLWLQSMIAHHRGAVAMAQNEIAHGQSPDIISMAKSVAAFQQAAIDQMSQMPGG